MQIDRSTDDQVWGEPHTPREFLTPSASLGLLSPLSSMELSAEPLSPSTLAFFKAARARAFGARQEATNNQAGAFPNLGACVRTLTFGRGSQASEVKLQILIEIDTRTISIPCSESA